MSLNLNSTGGAGGIGRALAIKFSQCGAKIALWDLDKVCKIMKKVMLHNCYCCPLQVINSRCWHGVDCGKS